MPNASTPFTRNSDGALGPAKSSREADRTVDAKLVTMVEALEQRFHELPGKLPVAKTWRLETVTYQGEFVCHEGSTYQARKDTAQRPGGTDWARIAHADRNGQDGRTPNIRGTYDAGKTYNELDVVVRAPPSSPCETIQQSAPAVAAGN